MIVLSVLVVQEGDRRNGRPGEKPTSKSKRVMWRE